MNIYNYDSYRKIIHTWIDETSDRGARTQLAGVAQCSPSWITRVLSGSVQLTPDQALAIAHHLHLSESEEDYFVALVDQERAATPLLRQHISKRLQKLRAESHHVASSAHSDSKVLER